MTFDKKAVTLLESGGASFDAIVSFWLWFLLAWTIFGGIWAGAGALFSGFIPQLFGVAMLAIPSMLISVTGFYRKSSTFA